MQNQRRKTIEEQRYANRSHEQWVQSPATQEFLGRMRVWAELSAPIFRTAEEIAVYQANAITKGTYQEIIQLMRVPPYPGVEAEAEAATYATIDENEGDAD